MRYVFFATFVIFLVSFACAEETYPCGPEMNQQCSIDDQLINPADGKCSVEDEKEDAQCFSPGGQMESIDFSLITPSVPVNYFELRESGQFGPQDTDNEVEDEDENENGYEVINSSGELCAGATDPSSCRQSFEDLRATDGFAWHAHPLDRAYYIAVNRGESSYVVQTVEEVVGFLGTIETREEAMLLARAHGFYWGDPNNNDTTGIIRTVNDGFEMVVMQTVSLCDPIQTDRVWIRITSEGRIEEIDREIADRMVGWCS